MIKKRVFFLMLMIFAVSSYSATSKDLLKKYEGESGAVQAVMKIRQIMRQNILLLAR